MTKTDDARVIDALKADVAAATRILETEGILNYSGHMCTRVPGRDALIVQRRTDSRAELAPERMLIVDFNGVVIEGDGKPPSETAIHIEILRARPDINSVLHCHMDLAIAFTMMDDTQLVPMRARATRWQSGIPTHPDPSHIKLTEQGEELAKTLGPHYAALMRAHGMVVVAESPRAILSDAIHFKENAEALMQVLQAGKTPRPITEAEVKQILRFETRDHHIDKMWNYYVRKAIASGGVPAEWGVL